MLPTLTTTLEKVILPELRSHLLAYIPDEQFGCEPWSGTANIEVIIANEVAVVLEACEEQRNSGT